ncbi:hypothetical protein HZC31_08435 [Candidatus Woesearchaeota archaeon]|nr:hypothetical protein [Candidatus Woesearchaeota archaeon]
MSYNTIFWVEDHPDIIARIAAEQGFDLAALLKKMTLAYDYSTAAKITAERLFDIYILDGDFPTAINGRHFAEVDLCVRMMQMGAYEERYQVREISIDENTGNNFVPFYYHCLSNKPGAKVIFSASTLAASFAHLMHVPFYLKGNHTPDAVRQLVSHNQDFLESGFDKRIQDIIRENRTSDTPLPLEEWECGGTPAFVGKYLLSHIQPNL